MPSVCSLRVCAGGTGLFGTMLADKLARPLAEALVTQVNSIIERREEEEARAIRILQNGGGVCPLFLPSTQSRSEVHGVL